MFNITVVNGLSSYYIVLLVSAVGMKLTEATCRYLMIIISSTCFDIL